MVSCIVLDKKTIGFYFSSYSWNKTPPITCSKVSISTLNFPSLFRRTSTSWLVILSLSSLNAFWYSSSYFHSFFPLSSLRGFTIWFRITYWFWELLCTEVHYIMPIPNLQQNTSACCCFLYLHPPKCFCSLSFVLTCNLLLSILLYCTYNTF